MNSIGLNKTRTRLCKVDGICHRWNKENSTNKGTQTKLKTSEISDRDYQNTKHEKYRTGTFCHELGRDEAIIIPTFV